MCVQSCRLPALSLDTRHPQAGTAVRAHVFVICTSSSRVTFAWLQRCMERKCCRCHSSCQASCVQVGEAVTARITVLRASGSRVTFDTACLSGAGEVLVDGQAVALIQGP